MEDLNVTALNSTAIKAEWRSLTYDSFTVTVSSELITTVPESANCILTTVISNLCPETEYNVTISGSMSCEVYTKPVMTKMREWWSIYEIIITTSKN